jgi:hypothetical protein
MKEKLARDESAPAQQRGIALIGVIGLLLVFLIFAGAMLDQLAYELNSVKMGAVSNRALAAADAGVRDMVAQLQWNLAHNAGLPATQNYSYPEPGASPSVVRFQSSIVKWWPSGSVNYYLIESTGTYQNNALSTVNRTVRALVKSQPLADYASFSNYETNQFGNQVWYLSTQHFNGPVYSGGPMHIAYATPAPSPGPTVEPIFLQQVQTVNLPVWSPGSPGSPNDWLSVIAGGQQSFTTNAQPLSLPQSSKNVAVASEAWEGDANNTFPSGFPAVAPGVYIDGASSGGKDAANSGDPVDTTGIYINTANTSATITSTVSGGTDTMKITSPAWSGTYIVTMNYPSFAGSGSCAGTTTVTFGSAAHTFSGTPCGEPGVSVTNTGAGAIFADGNINLGNGATPNTTIEGAYTIAVPDYAGFPTAKSNGASINILDNLTYDGASSLYDELGLWANDVVLTGTNTSNVQIDAAIIAGWPGEPSNDGTFNNANCTKTTCGTGSQGTLTILGSLVENARGAVGEVVGGNQIGFSRIIDFDQRFATNPPPYNPSTGELNIIAWEDIGT